MHGVLSRDKEIKEQFLGSISRAILHGVQYENKNGKKSNKSWPYFEDMNRILSDLHVMDGQRRKPFLPIF
uniref:Uncharacterized protein n=1 Tax=Quercus lobata TaxID=97700 RepID=A0A7N2RAX4_QUELO